MGMEKVVKMKSREEVEELLKSKYFCIIPWVHMHVTCKGNMSACMSLLEGPSALGFGNLNEQSFEEIWQGEKIRNFRKRLLSGKQNHNCKKCYDRDAIGFWSQRKEANIKYANYADWVAETTDEGYAYSAKPVYWDIRISNKCNLKCRICNFSSSSSWYEDALKLNLISEDEKGQRVHGIRDREKFFNEVKKYIKDLKMLHSAGGEPFLHEENKWILKELIRAGNLDVEIKYNTNLSLVDKEYLELWKHFRNIQLWVSIDGIDNRFEYIRKNSKFQTLIKNIEMLSELSNVELYCDITVSIFNIMVLVEFHRWIIESGYFRPDRLILNLLYMPNYLSIKILPSEMKKEVTEKIKDHIAWLKSQEYMKNKDVLMENSLEQWETCIRYLNSEDLSHLIPTFLEKTSKLDEIRGESFISVFPELQPLLLEERKTKNTILGVE